MFQFFIAGLSAQICAQLQVWADTLKHEVEISSSDSFSWPVFFPIAAFQFNWGRHYEATVAQQ